MDILSQNTVKNYFLFLDIISMLNRYYFLRLKIDGFHLDFDSASRSAFSPTVLVSAHL